MITIERRTFILGFLTLLGAGPVAAAVRGWPKGYVSITYDDGLSSQIDLAVPQLERAGLQGTFYITWENMADRAGEWAALPGRGHQLANHTVTHPCDLRPFRPSRFKSNEVDPVQHWLKKVQGEADNRDFAYPCDVTDLGPGTANDQARRYAHLLKRSGIRRARTSEGPPNSLHWLETAPYRLQALALAYNTQSLADVKTYLVDAMKRGRWAILVVHEIGTGARTDGFISAAEHQGLLDLIKELGIPCGTVRSAVSAVRAS